MSVIDKMFGSAINDTFMHVHQLQQEIKTWKHFFHSVSTWRSLELSYVAGLSKMIGNIKQKSCPISTSLRHIITSLCKSHQSLVEKINFDVVLVDYETSNLLLDECHKLIEVEKQTCKEIVKVKQVSQKIIEKFEVSRKNLFEQLTLEILSQDNLQMTMSTKLRKFNKIKQLQKDYEEHKGKAIEIVQLFDKLEKKSDSIMTQLQKKYEESMACRHETLMKIHLHICSCWKGLNSNLSNLTDQITHLMDQKDILKKFIRKTYPIAKRKIQRIGYLETLLKQINQKKLDQVIQYSKDQQIKSRVKRMVESDDVNPEETDEVSRQVQMIKNILKNSEDQNSINCFNKLIHKGYKCRLNFIFIMQSFRLNGKFLISQQQLKGLKIVITDVLNCCDEYKDSFVLKQLMILLMTYYVKSEQGQKIYIIHFFKKHSLWRDIQFWQSILLECVYSQKKNTRKMLLVTIEDTTSQQLLQAQNTAILNQVLYVVKNMVIFDYTQKQVKTFACRFAKLLKQDQNALNDIYKIIEMAVKDEIQQDQTIIVNEYSSKIHL